MNILFNMSRVVVLVHLSFSDGAEKRFSVDFTTKRFDTAPIVFLITYL